MIHLKDEFVKCFSHVVMNHIKDKMTSEMTPFQIGAKSGHRGQEHLFVLKSIMSKCEYLNQPTLISGYDVSKFFDFEQISDVLGECHKLKVRVRKE